MPRIFDDYCCKLLRYTNDSPRVLYTLSHATTLGYYFCKLLRRTKISPRVFYTLTPSFYVSELRVYSSSFFCKLLRCTKSSPRVLCTLPHATICELSMLRVTTSASFFDVRKARPEHFTPYPMLLCEYALGYYFCKLLRCTKLSPRVLYTLNLSYYVSVLLFFFFCKLLRCTKSSPRVLDTLIPSYYASLFWGFTGRCKLLCTKNFYRLCCRKFPTTRVRKTLTTDSPLQGSCDNMLPKSRNDPNDSLKLLLTPTDVQY